MGSPGGRVLRRLMMLGAAEVRRRLAAAETVAEPCLAPPLILQTPSAGFIKHYGVLRIASAL